MTKLGPYIVHPAAAIFAELPDDELKQLADDIDANGLHEPVILTADRKTLVDGRNRYRACDMLNMEPRYETLPENYGETEILNYIVSANIKRRHLNPGQVAAVAVKLKPLYAQAAKQRMSEGGRLKGSADRRDLGKAAGAAAKAVGAAERTVERAAALERDAEELFDKVVSGEMTLDAADKQRKAHNKSLPKPEPKPKPNRADPILLTLHTHDGAEVKYPMPQSKPSFNETTGDGISWAAWSWNPVTGCLHGCEYCYAREIATTKRFADSYPAGFTPLFHHERLDAPQHTKIPAKHRDDNHSCDDGECQTCAYRRVFVCSMADLYGRWVPQEWIDQVHASMLKSPQWQYITLTKFPDRYAGLAIPDGAWVGTSVDEQKRVRIAERAFRELPDRVIKWLSLEPLREPLQFEDLSMFDWVVIGAQTETRQPTGVVPAFAPPLRWVTRLIAQADEAGCKIHCKPNLKVGPGMSYPNEYPMRHA